MAFQAQIAPLIGIMVLRPVKGDDLWMSQTSGNGTFMSFDFIWNTSNETALLPVFLQIEQALKPFNARPHWGKYFTTAPGVFLPLYPKLDAFK